LLDLNHYFVPTSRTITVTTRHWRLTWRHALATPPVTPRTETIEEL
jgi:hypothetical protein